MQTHFTGLKLKSVHNFDDIDMEQNSKPKLFCILHYFFSKITRFWDGVCSLLCISLVFAALCACKALQQSQEGLRHFNLRSAKADHGLNPC